MKNIQLLFLLLLIIGQTNAQLKLSPIFSKHMVLQQKKPVAIWGKGTPNTTVQINFLNQQYSTNVDASGKWKTFLNAAAAGGPFTLNIKDQSTSITIDSVMIGEVWVASGQSNMEWYIRDSKDPEVHAQVNNPNLRMFQLHKLTSTEPVEELEAGEWVLTTPENIKNFSAVGFHYGNYLANELKVPVGIIHTSWGATSAEAWTSRQTLLDNNHMVDDLKAIPDTRAGWNDYLQDVFDNEKIRNEIRDTASVGTRLGVHLNKYDDSQWETAKYPVQADKLFPYPYYGFMWFRNHFTLDKNISAKELNLVFPKLQAELADIYLDGQLIAEKKPSSDSLIIKLPNKSIKKGKHVIAIRVYHYWAQHKIGHPETHGVEIQNEKKQRLYTLPEDWRYNFLIEPEVYQLNIWFTKPTVLFNAMIYPLQQYGISGFIWYQGESNAHQGYDYVNVLDRMITDWRNHFQQGDLPFYIVQLANFMEINNQPNEGGWAKVRDAQFNALKLKNTGLAVTIDVGEAYDIHPRDKESVGHRLAKWALAKNYKKDLVYTGPLYSHYAIEGDAIRIYFKDSKSPLQLKNSDRLSFIIAGEDKKFHWTTDVKIEGNTLLIRSKDVPFPRAVRYAWANNPAAILFNAADLPASPFRTDRWND